MSLRESDSRAELAVSGYLDRHFYPNFVQDFRRITDKEQQINGIDVIFSYNDLKEMIVDEKTSAHYVNKDLPTFAFELDFMNRAGQISEGWLFSESKKTQYYILSWIWATKDKDFTEDDITRMDVMLIERNRIISMLDEFGVTQQAAKDKALFMRREKTFGSVDKNGQNPFWFYHTEHLSEKPINIIIRKRKLAEIAILSKTI